MVAIPSTALLIRNRYRKENYNRTKKETTTIRTMIFQCKLIMTIITRKFYIPSQKSDYLHSWITKCRLRLQMTFGPLQLSIFQSYSSYKKEREGQTQLRSSFNKEGKLKNNTVQISTWNLDFEIKMMVQYWRFLQPMLHWKHFREIRTTSICTKYLT